MKYWRALVTFVNTEFHITDEVDLSDGANQATLTKRSDREKYMLTESKTRKDDMQRAPSQVSQDSGTAPVEFDEGIQHVCFEGLLGKVNQIDVVTDFAAKQVDLQRARRVEMMSSLN